jgi:branched-chain amino acid transport system permease protein
VTLLAQIFLNALLLGGVYAMIGIGFSLVWGVMNVINLAHGAFIVLGAYTTYWLFTLLGIDPFLSVPISMLVLFVIAYPLQRFLINLVIRTGVFMTLILTFGLQLLIVNFLLVTFKADFRSVTPAYAGSGIEIAGLVVPYVRLAIFVTAVVVTAALFLFMNRTRTGNAIRATALNRIAAQIVGVNIGHIYALTFAISAALAGAAGALISTIYSFSPSLQGSLLGKAFIIAVLGGLGSPVGAIIGGLVLALAEAFGGALLGTSYQDALGFLILVLVLILRPEGIAGKRFFAEVK